jgi:SAM-dependent methyltransferase
MRTAATTEAGSPERAGLAAYGRADAPSESAIWGSAPWERVAHLLAPVHAHLIEVLSPQPGVRWLDLATGTGAAAMLAARAGAEVTGLDIAAPLIQTARRLAARDGVRVRFDVGDAETLPYEVNSFDVMSSAMRIIFAADHRAVARELARACRPGGRIAFSAWREGAGWRPVTSGYTQPLGPGEANSMRWGHEQYARMLLGGTFELRFEHGDAPITGDSGEHIWQLLRFASGPFKTRTDLLTPAQRERLHGEFVTYLDQHRHEGQVRVPAAYVMIIGTRRG